MEIDTAVQVKVSFNEELRRFSLLRDASFKQLFDNIVLLCNISPDAQIVIKYLDNDKDEITMSSDAELREALHVVPSDSILRLHVSLRPSAPVALPSAPSTNGVDIGLEDLTMRDAPLYPHLGPGGFGGFGGFPSSGRGPFIPPHHATPFGDPFRGGPHSHGPHAHPPYFGPHGAHGGPMRGGRQHHCRAAGPFAAPHEIHGATTPFGPYQPNPNTNANPNPNPNPNPNFEERRRRKEERMQFKEQRKAWKAHWQAMSKEEREQLKEQKKDMKRRWKADMKDHREDRTGKPKLQARHVKDISIVDGTELPPNAPFVKTWRIRNAGDAWPAQCRLLFISRKGDRMSAPDSVEVEGVVAGGQDVDISVPLVSPSEPGRYTSYFRLATPEGVKFGQRVWVSIMVTGSSSSSSSEGEAKYGNMAEMIEAMGFDIKRKHIVRLLTKHEGDVDKVVRILTKKAKGCEKH